MLESIFFFQYCKQLTKNITTFAIVKKLRINEAKHHFINNIVQYACDVDILCDSLWLLD